ncbi:MAG: SIS domain-containing protein [Bacteroidales bacterium]|nr:SIS domain-containing protein [Bacteroidales bacterium]
MSKDSIDKAEKFLAISSQYKLGSLVTESSHPLTKNLSDLAKNNLPKAIEVLKELDNFTVSVLVQKQKEICFLKEAISETLNSGNNVFYCGCGATGRLSLTIETLWRQVHANDDLKDRVFSFMSGGDVALIRSIENFEDFPGYGARQLHESGFKDGDLLVATTEGGETPFVIGATEEATRVSRRKPFFLYCNPDDILSQVAERSRLVIENKNIEKINLTVGPMAVTGSTRMQSSTILLAAAGVPLFFFNDSNDSMCRAIENFADYWKKSDISFISKFIIRESDIYKDDEYLLYETDNKLGITVITDTTERSPTFSLFPFENANEADQKISLCYLHLPETENSNTAWASLLWREPRTLEWPDISGIASRKRLLGFDFSKNVVKRRESLKSNINQHSFKLYSAPGGINISLDGENNFIPAPFSIPLFVHLSLKMIMNTHSTLIMGRLGRYEGNVMTYVRASNNKLIDRAIRYIDMILKNRNIILSYEEICHALFEMIEITPGDSSIVLATVEEIEKRIKN